MNSKILFFSVKLLIINYLLIFNPIIGWTNNQKRALIITIGKYSAGSGWEDLSSNSDLLLMKETFRNQGFLPSNILTISLLDIQPDGKINIILPDERLGFGIENVRLFPNQLRGFKINGFTPPLGIEKFKVIMTPDYQDFSFLQTNTRHFANKGQENESPLQKLFKDLTEGSIDRTQSRGSSKITTPSMGGTASFTFKIVDGDK